MLHVDPASSGAYEWWYFDTLSDDGRYALVVIYFLGTPMSPYYKAIVDGKLPDPRDWCGVFVSLHEKIGDRWRERAYAYNLYRGGEFSTETPDVVVGNSSLTFDKTENVWSIRVTEPGLWRGLIDVEATFTAPKASFPTHLVEDADHTWVCVAPVCHAEARVLLASGAVVNFTGSGYHDHNFGRLPWEDVEIWQWGRAPLRASDGFSYQLIYYYLGFTNQPHRMAAFLFDERSQAEVCVTDTFKTLSAPVNNSYGMKHETRLSIGALGRGGFSRRFLQIEARLLTRKGLFAEGSFYRRLPVVISVVDERAKSLSNQLPGETWEATGEGISEVFRPARLCGPIASRAMWTRMRRRRRS